VPLSERALLRRGGGCDFRQRLGGGRPFRRSWRRGRDFRLVSEAVHDIPGGKVPGSVVPYTKFFATLNSAVFSDGLSVHSKGVRCPMELSSYSGSINDSGQFEGR